MQIPESVWKKALANRIPKHVHDIVIDATYDRTISFSAYIQKCKIIDASIQEEEFFLIARTGEDEISPKLEQLGVKRKADGSERQSCPRNEACQICGRMGHTGNECRLLKLHCANVGRLQAVCQAKQKGQNPCLKFTLEKEKTSKIEELEQDIQEKRTNSVESEIEGRNNLFATLSTHK